MAINMRNNYTIPDTPATIIENENEAAQASDLGDYFDGSHAGDVPIQSPLHPLPTCFYETARPLPHSTASMGVFGERKQPHQASPTRTKFNEIAESLKQSAQRSPTFRGPKAKQKKKK